MKNIYILLIILLIAGCVSYPIDSFLSINEVCTNYNHKYNRWPTAKELEEFDKNNSTNQIDWNSISNLSIKKVSEDQAYIAFAVDRWYGKETVSGSVYRPKTDINYK